MTLPTDIKALSPDLSRSVRPWWLEMALVDLRHAFWPWLAYAAAVYMMGVNSPVVAGFIIPVLILTSLAAASGVVTQVFCADFDSKTMSALLVFPRERSKIWIARFLLCAGILILPVAVTALVPGLEADALALISTFAFCALTVGSMLCLILRRTLITWSAILISPLALIILCSIWINMFGLDDNGSFSEEFPYVPINFLVFFLVCGAVSTIYAWRLWVRLEVRS